MNILDISWFLNCVLRHSFGNFGIKSLFVCLFLSENWGRKVVYTTKDMRELLWVMELLYNLIDVTLQNYICVSKPNEPYI